MTEEKKNKPRPKYNPKNKEHGSKKKKIKWRKKPRQKKDLGESLKELQAHINSRYHSP